MQAMLSAAPNMKLPAFLLACVPGSADATGDLAVSSTASSAELLKALLSARQLREASHLIEEQLDRCDSPRPSVDNHTISKQ